MSGSIAFGLGHGDVPWQQFSDTVDRVVGKARGILGGDEVIIPQSLG